MPLGGTRFLEGLICGCARFYGRQFYSNGRRLSAGDLTGDSIIDWRDFRYGVMVNGVAPDGTNLVKVGESEFDNGRGGGWEPDQLHSVPRRWPGGHARGGGSTRKPQ